MKKFFQVALVLAVVSSAAHANLLTNGSFETGDLSGWTANADNTIDVNTGYGATDGMYSAQLDYYKNSGAGIDYLQQSFNTIAGTTYTVDFDFEAAPFLNVVQTMVVSVTGGATTLALLDVSDISNGNVLPAHFSHFSTTFVANSSSATLKFLDTSPDTFNTNALIDNVVVDVISVSTVPEPESWALFSLGLAGLGFMTRRRTAQWK
jgi:hypothetical protein